jgi:MFS family permease
LTVCGGAHALHDGFTDLLNVLYPLLQAQFGLSYAAIGAFKTVYSGGMAVGQIPSGKLAVRFGGVRVLAIGTALIAVGYGLAGLTGSIYGVVIGLLLAGLGGSTQHPIGSSLVSAAYSGLRSRTALGTYNFTGDLGKMALPAVFAVIAAALGWQQALIVIAAFAVAGAGVILATLKPVPLHDKGDAPRSTMAGQDRPWAYWLLFSIHIADDLVRTGFLIFLPFLLRDKGADIPTIGLGLSLLQAGDGLGGREARRGAVGDPDRGGNDCPDPAVAAGRTAARAGASAGGRADAERHVLGALRHDPRIRQSRETHARLRDLLHRRLGRRRDRPTDLGFRRRRRRPADRAHHRVLHRADDGADGVGAEAGVSLAGQGDTIARSTPVPWASA